MNFKKIKIENFRSKRKTELCGILFSFLFPQWYDLVLFLFFLSASLNVYLQGRVRTKTIKKASRLIIEKYYPRLTLDFQTNKRLTEEVAVVPSKKVRNKIAGYVTHLMRRIEKGPVRGISFKLQEEERERKDNYVPEVSAVNTSNLQVSPAAKEMLDAIGFGDLQK